MSVVSDSSPLIFLSMIAALELLPSLYGSITIPQAVYREVVIGGRHRPGSQEVSRAQWIVRRPVKRVREVTRLMTTFGLDRGESETIVLAEEIGAQLIILDDERARAYSRQHQLPATGTAGVLLAAKRQGLIPAVKPLIEALIAGVMRLTPAVHQMILRDASE